MRAFKVLIIFIGVSYFNFAGAQEPPSDIPMIPPTPTTQMSDSDKKIIEDELKTAECKYLDVSKATDWAPNGLPGDPHYRMVPSPGCSGDNKLVPMISGVVSCSGKTIGGFTLREVVCFPKVGPNKKPAFISARDCAMQNFFDTQKTGNGENTIFQESKKIEGSK